MLKIFDKNHNAIGHIVKYKDCKIESELSNGDKTLSFTYLAKHHSLENEMYVRTKDDEYVIKEVPAITGSFPQIVAILNLEDLQKDMWEKFSVTDVTIDEAVRPLLAGTGWTIGECDVVKHRNAGMIQVSTLEAIQKLCIAFMCEPVFDTINKKVSFYSKRGEDKGTYFMSGLNLKKLQKKVTSYDYYTRIIPIGANGLSIESVNDGKNYLENYQYSNKVLTYIWKDESYTDPQALKEDAGLKLDDLSKPEKAYSAEIYNLAKQKQGYSILSYGLGDTIILIDRETGTREKQRIVRTVEYPQDHSKDTCEIANTFLTFEEMQQKVQSAAEIIDYTITGDGRYTGTINVSDILHFEQGVAGSSAVSGINSSIATMQGDLGQIKVKIGEVETNYLKADEAELKYATIETLNVTNQTVHSIQGDYLAFRTTVTDELSAQRAIIDSLDATKLEARVAVIEEAYIDRAEVNTLLADYARATDLEAVRTRTQQLETDVADINTLVNGNLTSDNIQSMVITGDKFTVENGFIKSAMIENLAADKITGLDINTTKLTVHSEDGRSTWTDNTIQIADANRVRVQIGEDASGDYNLYLWDSAGNMLWNATGVTESGLNDGIIKDVAVAENANIAGSKLDIESVIREVNGAETTIKGTRIKLDEQNQTLDAAFSTLKTYAEGVNSRTESNETAISVAQGQISTLISNTTIVKDGQTVQLKEAFNSTVTDVNSIKTTLNEHTSLIDEQSGEILAVQTKANTIESDLNGTKQTVSAVQSDLSGTKSRVTTVETGLDGLKSRVSATETALTKKADGTTVDTLTSRVATAESTLDGFEASLTATSQKVSANEKSISSHDTRITANENAVKLKVSTTDFNSYKTTVNNELTSAKSRLSTAESSITAMKGEIALKVGQTDIDTAVQGIELGGTQILRGTNKVTVLTSSGAWRSGYWRSASGGTGTRKSISVSDAPNANIKVGWELSETSGAVDIAQDDIPVTYGQIYTISCYARWISGTPVLRFQTWKASDASHVKTFALTSNDGTWKRYSFTFTHDFASYKNNTNIYFGNGGNGTLQISGMMLETGNKVGDWSESPYDIDSSINAVDAKFANYSTTTQMQSAINLAKDSITQSVSSTYATKTEVSTVSGKVTSLESWKSEASQKITKDGIIATVGNYYAYESDLTKAESRITTAESTITQHTKDISLRVKEADVTGNYVIGKINLSSTTATIEAKHINLVGAVTVSALASDALGKITTAQSTADSAKTAAANAQSTANTAKTNAATAQSTADTAKTNAATAQSTANTANSTANTAKTNAATAQSTADAAKTAAANAQSTANTARAEIASLGKVTVKKYDITGSSGSVKWIKLGTLVSNGDASNVIINVYTGNGYNGTANQNSQVEIIIKDGRQSTQSAATSFGVSVTRQNCESLTVKVMATAHNTCDVWVYMPWQYWNGMYTIVGSYSSWTHSGANQSSAPTTGTEQNLAYRANAENATTAANLANTTLANWCYNNDKTYINGGKIYTGTVAAAQIATKAVTAEKINVSSLSAITANLGTVTAGTIQSANYSSSSSEFTAAGTRILLSTGEIRSKNFAVDGSGNAYFRGTLQGASGSFSGTVNASSITAKDKYSIYSGNKSRTFLYYNATSDTFELGLMDSAATSGSDNPVGFSFSPDGYIRTRGALSVLEGFGCYGAAKFSGATTFAANAAFSNAATFNGETTVNGVFHFKDYSGTMRRPIATTTTDGSRISHIAGNLSNGVKIAAQWNVAGASYSSKTFTASSSDIRLKENICPTEVEALPLLNQIGIYQFDWRQDHYHQKIGFVADYLEKLDGHLSLGGGYDENGNMDEKVVNDFYLMGYVVKGIQELCTQTTDHAVRVDSALTAIRSELDYTRDTAISNQQRLSCLETKTQADTQSIHAQLATVQAQLQQALSRITEQDKLIRQLQAAG